MSQLPDILTYFHYSCPALIICVLINWTFTILILQCLVCVSAPLVLLECYSVEISMESVLMMPKTVDSKPSFIFGIVLQLKVVLSFNYITLTLFILLLYLWCLFQYFELLVIIKIGIINYSSCYWTCSYLTTLFIPVWWYNSTYQLF